MLGWFSAFRENGAPTSYGENRTPVSIDTQVFGLTFIFAIPSLAFLIIFPAIRNSKFISATLFLSMMAVGSVILVGIYCPKWHIASVHIDAPYKSFSNETLSSMIEVQIGLNHVNISLIAETETQETNPLMYNERFDISEMHLMERELARALNKGLPYPILKVVEYLSVDRAGFVWGRTYRVAGYYTAVLLWFSTACWTVTLVYLCLLPNHFIMHLFFTGLFVTCTALVYATNVPGAMDITFPVSGKMELATLNFVFGGAFYSTLLSGCYCLALSAILQTLKITSGYRIDTILTSRRNSPFETSF